eukprot:scaffold918_cov126-Cylindrotheca_fusiformis.AAC.7
MSESSPCRTPPKNKAMPISPTSPIQLLQGELLSCPIDDITEEEDYQPIGRCRCRRGSILKSSKTIQNGKPKKRVSFHEEEEIFPVTRHEDYYSFFYDEQSMSDFRYNAILWEAGMVDDNGDPFALTPHEDVEEREKCIRTPSFVEEGSMDIDEWMQPNSTTSRDEENRDYPNHESWQWRTCLDLFQNVPLEENKRDGDEVEYQETKEEDDHSIERQETLTFRQKQEFLQRRLQKSPNYINRRKFDGQRRRVSFEMSRKILFSRMGRVIQKKKRVIVSSRSRPTPTNNSQGEVVPKDATSHTTSILNNSESLRTQLSVECDDTTLHSSLLTKHNMYSPKLVNTKHQKKSQVPVNT